MNSSWLSCSSSATDSTNSASTGAGGSSSWIFMILIIVVFVVLIIVPQKRREKKIKSMLDAVKVGDRVRTIGGIYGTVMTVKDDLITIETGSDKTTIVFSKGAIATVETAEVDAGDIGDKK